MERKHKAKTLTVPPKAARNFTPKLCETRFIKQEFRTVAASVKI